MVNPIRPLSDPPDTNDPANFDARADLLFNVDLPNVVTDFNGNVTELNDTIEAIPLAIAAANYRGEYAAGVTYQQGQSVSYLGERYASKTNNNIGNTPDTSPANWLLIALTADRVNLVSSVDNVEYPVIFAGGDGGPQTVYSTGVATYNPSLNLASFDISGNAATASVAASVDGGAVSTDELTLLGEVIAGGTAGTTGQALLSGGTGAAPLWASVPFTTDPVVFTTSGSFVVPVGVTRIFVQACGAGGGGGTANDGITAISGGAGGAGFIGAINVIPESTLTITIGSGGAGGNGPSLIGVDGGSTTITDGSFTLTLGGGQGGVNFAGSTTVIANGGTPTISGVQIVGLAVRGGHGATSAGISTDGTTVVFNAGPSGTSIFGGGNSTGGNMYGSGGYSTKSSTGGSGGNGVVMISY